MLKLQDFMIDLFFKSRGEIKELIWTRLSRF